MTEVEKIESALNSVKITLTYLESKLKTYRQRESQLTMDLNRARRLEREARELQQ